MALCHHLCLSFPRAEHRKQQWCSVAGLQSLQMRAPRQRMEIGWVGGWMEGQVEKQALGLSTSPLHTTSASASGMLSFSMLLNLRQAEAGLGARFTAGLTIPALGTGLHWCK